ncbi:MAG: cyclase family protein [Chloroflexi bacterium]|nr:cyclase family protein [Chloroflexota bacterium]
MKIFDITLTITPDMPRWPGDPPLEVARVATLEAGDGYNLTRLAMSAHTGTHVDAPAHFLPDGGPVEDLPLAVLIGRAVVADLTSVERVIDREAVKAAGIPARTRRVLLKTRNSALWAQAGGRFREDYVALGLEAARWLIGRGYRLVGVDYLSVAPFEDPAPVHLALLGAGVVVLEGLDLSNVRPGRYGLICLPLKVGGADGAPARAILTRP